MGPIKKDKTMKDKINFLESKLICIEALLRQTIETIKRQRLHQRKYEIEQQLKRLKGTLWKSSQ